MFGEGIRQLRLPRNVTSEAQHRLNEGRQGVDTLKAASVRLPTGRRSACPSTRGGLAQCITPATSQRIRGNVRRTHRSLSGFSFSPGLARGFSTLDRLVQYRPRFLLHGVVAAVGVAAIASLAIQPRPAPVVLP